jgi:hypothetical protein
VKPLLLGAILAGGVLAGGLASAEEPLDLIPKNPEAAQPAAKDGPSPIDLTPSERPLAKAAKPAATPPKPAPKAAAKPTQKTVEVDAPTPRPKPDLPASAVPGDVQAPAAAPGPPPSASDPAPAKGGTPAGTVDDAYGAFQRGYYLTAFALAIQNAETGNTAAKTLVGLIY